MAASKKLSPLDQAQKEQRMIDFRAQGMTLEQIRVIEGYTTVSAVSRALNQAYAKIPSPTVRELRAQSDTTNDLCRRYLMRIIEFPPIQTTAIGRVVIDPRTGEPVIDEARRIAAIAELRKLDDSRRRLYAADRAPLITHDEAQRQAEQWLADLNQRITETTVTAEVIPQLEPPHSL